MKHVVDVRDHGAAGEQTMDGIAAGVEEDGLVQLGWGIRTLLQTRCERKTGTAPTVLGTAFAVAA